MSEPLLIDAWAQLPERAEQIVPEVRRLFQRSGTANVLANGVAVDDVIAQMDRVGIERLLLSAWHRPRAAVLSNDDVAAVV